ncbi:MAG: AraC family transcriptional regulator [Verrucomicrobiota bacterium]
MKRPPNKITGTTGSAIFLSHKETYHADRCEPLVQAMRRGEVRVSSLARRGYPGSPMPEGMLPEVSTIGFWDAKGTQNWGLDWHRNEGIELTYLSRGKTDFLVEDQQHLLESGHLTVTRPWQRHRLGNPNIGATRLHWLILDVNVRRPNQPWRWPDWLILSADDLLQLTRLLSHNEQSVWLGNDEIAACFERLAGLIQHPDAASTQSRLRLFINELFLAVLDLLQAKKVTLDERLVSSRRTVELFLAALPSHLEHPWTLDEMAQQCGLGRSRFADHCRQIVNMAPADYLIHCRVEMAKKLLQSQPGSNITDVALACGFQSSQYFATMFRRRIGQTPRDFRESAAVD